MDAELIANLLVVFGLLAFAALMIGMGVYSIGLQRKATKAAIPKTIELQERSVANQEESMVRIARSLELQEKSATMYERSVALQEESLALLREVATLLRGLNEKLDRG